MTAPYNVIDVRDPGQRVILKYVELPNGAIHDGDGSGAAVLLPAQQIDVEVMIKVDSHAATPAADFDTAVAALEALRGTVVTLTGADSSGTTMTCSARLVDMPYATSRRTHEHYWETYTLRFAPKGHWG